MTSENNYEQKFQRARTAYIEGDLEQASNILAEMSQDFPEDPNVLLLRGHIHFSHDEYDIAKNNYQKVLDLTDREELVDLARQALEKIEDELQQENDNNDNYPFSLESVDEMVADELENCEENYEVSDEGWTQTIQFDNIEWDEDELQEELEDITDISIQAEKLSDEDDFYSFDFEDEAEDTTASSIIDNVTPSQKTELIDYNSHEEEEDSWGTFDASTLNYEIDELEDNSEWYEDEIEDDNSAPTFAVDADAELEPELRPLEEMVSEDSQIFQDDENYSSVLQPLQSQGSSDTLGKSETLHESLISENDEQPLVPEGEEDFFFAPGDLDDIPDIDADQLPVSSIFAKEHNPDRENFDQATIQEQIENIEDDNVFDNDFDSSDLSESFNFDTQTIDLDGDDNDEDESISFGLSETSTVSSVFDVTPEVDIAQGQVSSRYYNWSLLSKQLFHGGFTAIVTFIAVLLVGVFSGTDNLDTTENNGDSTAETATEEIVEEQAIAPLWLLALSAGAVAGLTTISLGILLNSHLKRYLQEFTNQLDSIYQGNYNVRVTVYSLDEFGSLAAGFNQMSKMIKTTTKEARKRAEETEKAREDLQRQVIRLLDDVEGAARGDLTVQAEVTADVLGAVADAFNLTINSLRKIVKQVKQSAIQVNKASADSEVYARNQSSDALRMAEELAVTLNSVQMMTDSIQRVAENAQEAEEVARSSSVTALKGGDAVERTVAGILQIRETVSETTRKVKRLAEASQQISTIVAVISQISSRTNLLALNASIQAARAGEAGRGFAIVADEVRQLADRSAKSLQEIEEIVLQIQTETGSVMMAMEEGIQQVKDVTDRSEQAKRALEDIIQVSNRIDSLVRSITADTDEQRENSRNVAKVMQDVELTAQATSQESQRVAGSLQNVVGIGKDLISSVERFKVD